MASSMRRTGSFSHGRTRLTFVQQGWLDRNGGWFLRQQNKKVAGSKNSSVHPAPDPLLPLSDAEYLDPQGC